jgi:hypothetical protein
MERENSLRILCDLVTSEWLKQAAPIGPIKVKTVYNELCDIPLGFDVWNMRLGHGRLPARFPNSEMRLRLICPCHMLAALQFASHCACGSLPGELRHRATARSTPSGNHTHSRSFLRYLRPSCRKTK